MHRDHVDRNTAPPDPMSGGHGACGKHCRGIPCGGNHQNERPVQSFPCDRKTHVAPNQRCDGQDNIGACAVVWWLHAGCDGTSVMCCVLCLLLCDDDRANCCWWTLRDPSESKRVEVRACAGQRRFKSTSPSPRLGGASKHCLTRANMSRTLDNFGLLCSCSFAGSSSALTIAPQIPRLHTDEDPQAESWRQHAHRVGCDLCPRT